MTLVSLTTASTAAPMAAGDAAPWQTMAIGLCEDYPPSTRTLEGARRDLEAAKRAGAKVLRISFSWCEIESAPGRYDLAFWDEYVRMAVDEYGLRLIPYVCYTPRWATDREGKAYYTGAPRDPRYFGHFVGMLARRYRDRIGSWELWNEPDNPAYWTGTAEEFAAMVKAGSAAVREANAKAKVVLGGIAWSPSFVETLFRDYGVSSAVDVVNMHAYFETWHEDAIEKLPEYVNRVADLVAQYGDGQELWMAEVGYANYRARGAGAVSEQYAARYGYEHTAEYQGDALVRTVTLAAATGKLALVAWYRINDLPHTTEVIGDVNNRYLGLVGEDGRAKPALGAFERVSRLFGRRFRCLDRRTMVVKAIASEAEVHSFGTAEGKTVVVAWGRTHRWGEGARPRAGDEAVEESGECVRVMLPTGEEMEVRPRRDRVEVVEVK